MFTPLHSSTNQELLEKYVCNQSSHYEKYDHAVQPQLSSGTEVSISLPCQLVTQQYESITVWKAPGSHYEKYRQFTQDDFHYAK